MRAHSHQPPLSLTLFLTKQGCWYLFSVGPTLMIRHCRHFAWDACGSRYRRSSWTVLAGCVHRQQRILTRSCSTKQAIGLIGLGKMGTAMAANLLRAGYPLVVYDVNGDAVERLVAKVGTGESYLLAYFHTWSRLISCPVTCSLSQGASAASSPEHLASQVKTFVTMLPNDTALSE